jgi:2-phosphoglycolate phosphatase
MPASGFLQAVLFDLDGTLLDTAPDMVGALNDLRAEQSQPPVDYGIARAHVSHGAFGLVDIAFERIDDAERVRLRDRFLEIYAGRVAAETLLFDGMASVLDDIEADGLDWGIVTNKPGHLTEPLLATLGILSRCACVVSGDTLPQRKPHPEPLLHAMRQINAAAEPGDAAQLMYVGDADRDIMAGKAAGMITVAATYGYIPPEDDPLQWNADHIIEHPRQLLDILANLDRHNRPHHPRG